MDTDVLRKRVEQVLGRDVANAVWRRVKPDSIELVLDDARGAFDDLLDEVGTLQSLADEVQHGPSPEVARRGARSGVSRRVRVLPSSAKRRAAVMANLVAGMAREDDDVVRFCRRLDGKLASPKDIPRLMSSLALQSLPWWRLEAASVPVLGHHASLTTYLRPGRPGEGQARVPGIAISWPSGKCTLHAPLLPHGKHDPYSRNLFWGAPGKGVETVVSLVNSFFHDLGIVSSLLASRYSWREAEATWFVLTDEPPEYLSALIDLHYPKPPLRPDGQIVLRLRPWVAAESVDRTYKACQRLLLGQRHRDLTEEKLALFEFVEANRPRPPERPGWKLLFEKWRQSSRSRHRSPPRTWRRFQGDYARVRAALLG